MKLTAVNDCHKQALLQRQYLQEPRTHLVLDTRGVLVGYNTQDELKFVLAQVKVTGRVPL